jgi:dTDP-glucose 4,6-dehydratase
MYKNKILNENLINIDKEINNLVIDIDGVIASIVADGNYEKAKPLKENIKYINNLKFHGKKIILFTARGSATGKDWSETTKLQIKKWGVLYDQLLFGKPAGDIYVDDKAATPVSLQILSEKYKK